jgi:hypothetical protein
VVLAAVVSPPGAYAVEGSKGPVGWDSYRRLDRLPELDSGTRTVQASSHDRTFGNDDGFRGTYSCPRRVATGCVLAEHRGPGEIDGIWFTRDYGVFVATGTLRVVLDGRTVIRRDLTDVILGKLGPPFSFPLVSHSAQSSGGGFVKTPMPFRRSMRVITENNPGYFHVIYRKFADRRGVPRFDPDAPALDVRSMLRAAGRRDPKQPRGRRIGRRETAAVGSHRSRTLVQLHGAGVVSGLRLRLRGLSDAAADTVFRGARLRIAFDGRRTVDAPLGEFFGSGLGPARVRSVMFAMGPRGNDWLSAWWPMPYASMARVSLTNPTRIPLPAVDVRLTAEPDPRWRRALRSRRVGHFRATSRGPSATTPGVDWNFLTARGRGKFVGVTQTMAGGKPENYLEGDESAFVDGSESPQITGTGTEDFYLGGWYFTTAFKIRTFTLPFNGFPVDLTAATGCPQATCKTAYRLMLAEAVPFRRSLRFGIQHGGRNDVPAVYGSTAYWYGPARAGPPFDPRP